MPIKKYRLAYFVSHPIQYQAPLLKLLSSQADIDLTVFFLTDLSTKNYKDTGFQQDIKWDTPLLEGYHYKFLESKLNDGDINFNNPKVSLASLKNAVSSVKWDAIWIHGYANKALLYLVYRCYKEKIPLFFRGESNLISTSKHRLKSLFIRRLITQSAALLSIGSDNKDYYLHYGADEKKIFSVPYAVDNNAFQKQAVKPQSNSTVKPEGKTIILFASKFIARKNPVMLIEAFNELPVDLRKNAELWFIGNGEQKEFMQSKIEQYGLKKSIKLLGFKNQSELPWYFSQCDVFVLPSQKEPFGLVINEVMNQGKAIITTNEVGAAKDLINRDNGWVINAGSKSELTRSLANAISNPQELKKMGQKSLAKISNWSYEQDIKGIRDALNYCCIK